MSKPLADRIPFTKIVTVLAVAGCVSFGLCGLGMVVSDGGNLQTMTGLFFGFVLKFGLVTFWLSFLALLLTCLVWIVVSIISKFQK